MEKCNAIPYYGDSEDLEKVGRQYREKPESTWMTVFDRFGRLVTYEIRSRGSRN